MTTLAFTGHARSSQVSSALVFPGSVVNMPGDGRDSGIRRTRGVELPDMFSTRRSLSPSGVAAVRNKALWLWDFTIVPLR